MNTTAGLQAEDFDTLDNILDDLRERFEETPQWEFCEGFMAAMVCSRRPIPAYEYLGVLLGLAVEGEEPEQDEIFPTINSCDRSVFYRPSGAILRRVLFTKQRHIPIYAVAIFDPCIDNPPVDFLQKQVMVMPLSAMTTTC